jgi:hypothetical protein
VLLDVYVDPSCPWSWVAAHWLAKVREVRDLEVTWRSFSLLLRDGDRAPTGMPPEIAAIALSASRQSLRLLRLFEALRQDGDGALIERLYFAWGQRVFVTGPPAPLEPGLVADIARQCEVPQQLVSALDDPAWDEPILKSMQTAASALGQSPITPTIVVTGQTAVALAGPVLSAAPAGAAAARLWDAVCAIAAEPAFHSLHRPAPFLPEFPRS